MFEASTTTHMMRKKNKHKSAQEFNINPFKNTESPLTLFFQLNISAF